MGTLLCGLARTYSALFVARTVTGVFAGVIGSVMFAIVTDLFDYQHRGRVMGIVQAAFAASSIVGFQWACISPNRWGWNAPFLLSEHRHAGGRVIVFGMRPITAHLAMHPDRSPLHHLLHTVTQPRYLQGLALRFCWPPAVSFCSPMPAPSAFNNLGVHSEKLPAGVPGDRRLLDALPGR